MAGKMVVNLDEKTAVHWGSLWVGLSADWLVALSVVTTVKNWADLMA